MKQLTDIDIEKMIGDEFVAPVKCRLKLNLHLSEPEITPKRTVIDLHNHTQEQAWEKLNAIIYSGTRFATIITGASGILKIKFQDWMAHSTLSPHIHSWRPLNNGSFEIHIKKTSKM